MLHPVVCESLPIVKGRAPEAVYSDMRKLLESVVATGPMLATVGRAADKVDMSTRLESTVRQAAPAMPRQEPIGSSSRREGLLAAGGILGAVAASSCCIVPL